MLTIKEVIKTLYNALLQRLKKHRGNWEQNDPTADDYIKNRPFYTDETNKEIVVKTTNFTATSSYWWGSPFAFIPIVGETYKVTFDDKEYICTCYESDGKCIGNIYVASAGNVGTDTGEPFFYYWYDSYEYGMRVRNRGKHTITIEKIKIVKIDERYLPETNNEEIERAIDNLYDYANYLEDEVWKKVSYAQSQNLSTSQKQTARTNIGAVSMTEVNTALNDLDNTKVDKVEGKALSSNDYTTEEKHKLAQVATYSSDFFGNGAVRPFAVTRNYGKSEDYIVLDFGVRFKPSDRIQEYANNGVITLTYGNKTFICNLGEYSANGYDEINGFSFQYSASANYSPTDIAIFTENGQIWITWDSASNDLLNDGGLFSDVELVTIELPDCIEVMSVTPPLTSTGEYYTDTIVRASSHSAYNRNLLHNAIGKTTLHDDGIYSSRKFSFSLIRSFPDLIVVDGVEYAKYGTGGINATAVYGNLALLPDDIYNGSQVGDPNAEFALVMSHIAPTSGTHYNEYHLYSKEEGYQLPEVYSRTYYTKQLDEKFIPSTIARTEDLEGLATEEYVNTKVSDLVNAAPEALDTLKELSTALGDDPNFATTVLTQLGNKADVASLEGLATETYVNSPKAHFDLIDEENGQIYRITMKNGNLVSQLKEDNTDE